MQMTSPGLILRLSPSITPYVTTSFPRIEFALLRLAFEVLRIKSARIPRHGGHHQEMGEEFMARLIGNGQMPRNCRSRSSKSSAVLSPPCLGSAGPSSSISTMMHLSSVGGLVITQFQVRDNVTVEVPIAYDSFTFAATERKYPPTSRSCWLSYGLPESTATPDMNHHASLRREWRLSFAKCMTSVVIGENSPP